MLSDPEVVVDRFYKAWFQADMPGIAACLDEHIRLSQHFADPALPFTGETYGRGACVIRLAKINADWCFLKAIPVHNYVDQDTVRTSVEVEIRHLESGETFEGTLRHIWRVRNRLITECDEYVDVARLKAFLRLLGLPA